MRKRFVKNDAKIFDLSREEGRGTIYESGKVKGSADFLSGKQDLSLMHLKLNGVCCEGCGMLEPDWSGFKIE